MHTLFKSALIAIALSAAPVSAFAEEQTAQSQGEIAPEILALYKIQSPGSKDLLHTAAIDPGGTFLMSRDTVSHRFWKMITDHGWAQEVDGSKMFEDTPRHGMVVTYTATDKGAEMLPKLFAAAGE